MVYLDSADEFVIAPVPALTFFGAIGDLVATSTIFEFLFERRFWKLAPVALLVLYFLPTMGVSITAG